MTFELSDSLIQNILFAMENQDFKSALDARTCEIIPIKENVDENVIFTLPSWSSKDGFALLEEFTYSLHSPLAKQELKDVLLTGRGVFRNFKKVVKQYPEIERKWHFFKNRKMISRIYKWYNALRESWGLESLSEDFDNAEETSELVLSDFVFRDYSAQTDKEIILCAIEQFSDDSQIQAEVAHSIASINKHFFSYCGKESDLGFLCFSLSQEFAGCIIASPSDSGKVFAVKSFFVLERFRGLGIATELLNQFFSALKSKGAKWVVFSNLIVRDSMQPLFTRFGLKNLECGYLFDLTAV